MSKIWWTKMEHTDDYIAHYSMLSDSEIVADVRRSIASFANHTPEGDDFGAKMVRKALGRINEKHDQAVEAGSLGGKSKAQKTITAAATTREGVDESTTGCNNMRRVPQNEAPAHGFSGGRTAQGTMSRSPEAAAKSGKDYDQEAKVSTDSPAGATDSGEGGTPGIELTSSSLPSPTTIKPKTDPKPTRKAKAEVKPEEQKYPHGEFENIMLTTDEYIKLCERLDNADELIAEADQYFEAQPDKKKKYKNHYAMLLSWDRRRKEAERPKRGYKTAAEKQRDELQKIADYYTSKEVVG